MAEFWKPGEPKPEASTPKSRPPGGKQPKSAREKKETSPAPRALGAGTMKMRFMNRGGDSKPASAAAATTPSAEASTPVTTQSTHVSGKKKAASEGFRWRLPVAIPDKAAPGDDTISCDAREPDALLAVLARRSFGGFNAAVERTYEDLRDEPGSKRSKRVEKEAISDKEMANFYAQRVGKFGSHGAKGQEKAKKRGDKIDGGAAAQQKRKRR